MTEFERFQIVDETPSASSTTFRKRRSLRMMAGGAKERSAAVRLSKAISGMLTTSFHGFRAGAQMLSTDKSSALYAT